MAKSCSSKRTVHVALAPSHLHSIPTRARNLRPRPHMHHPRQIKIRKNLSHTLRLHTGLPVDCKPIPPRHLMHPILVKCPPPLPPFLCSLCPCFKKWLAVSQTSPQNMANPNGRMFSNMASTSWSRLSSYHDAVPTVRSRREPSAAAALCLRHGRVLPGALALGLARPSRRPFPTCGT